MRYLHIAEAGFLFTLLLLIPTRFFFIINDDSFKSAFRISYDDFTYLVFVVLAVYLFLRYQKTSNGKFYFLSNVLLIIPLVIIASVVPNILFGQSIRITFWAQRFFMIMIIIYYVYRLLLVEDIITPEYLWDKLYKLSFVHTIIIMFQHAIADHVHILSVRYRHRFGPRITTNYTFSTILLIGSLCLFFSAKTRKEKMTASIGLIMSYYHCVFISQTRIVMVAYGIMTILMALVSRTKVLKKITYLFVLCGLILILLQSELGQYLLTAVSDSSTDTSAQIREIGKQIYIYHLIQSPVVGRGYPHYTSFESYEMAGMNAHINPNDNGIYAFGYFYGALGLLWYVWITIRMLICSYKAVKKGDYRFLLFTLFLQIICVNIIWWYWTTSFCVLFTIMLALMEDYQNKISNPKVRFYI